MAASEEERSRMPGTPIPTPPDFPVEWPDPADAKLHWTLDDDEPAVVLHASDDWPRRGIVHAHRYWNGPLANIREVRFNTYLYSARVPRTLSAAEFEIRAERARSALEALVDNIESRWTDDWYPRIRGALDQFASFDPKTASDGELAWVLQTADAPGRVLWEVHFELVWGCGYIRRQFDEYCRDVFGPATDLGTATLTAGDENWSVRGGEALRSLAEYVHEREELLAVILEAPGADAIEGLRNSASGRAFLTRFVAFVDTFGKKLTAGLTGPTWDEDPSLPLGNLRALLRMGEDFGASRRHAVVAAKERLLREARSHLRVLPRALAEEFERLYRSASFATRLMEDHNFYIDQQSAYYHRRLVVEAARRLIRLGRLGHLCDLELLTRDELSRALTGELDAPGTLVDERRQAMAAWKEHTPPRELGTIGAPSPPHPIFGPRAAEDGPDDPAPEPGLLRGLPASRGTVRAPVRVVTNLAGASALHPGEILVTTTMSPSWATWYPILGGLITETGGILTHAAVVAREYGIPAVVGTRGATRRLKTGDLVELDGSLGTIRMLDPLREDRDATPS